MNRMKLVLLILVLVLACSWGSWAQASQINLDYSLGLYAISSGQIYIPNGSSPSIGRLIYFYTPASGTMTEVPIGPGTFSQQVPIDFSFTIGTMNGGNVPWSIKGPDLITLNIPLVGLTVTSWLDQTEPFPVDDASWSLRKAGSTDILVGGRILDPGGHDIYSGNTFQYEIYSSFGTVEVPIHWEERFPGGWFGSGQANVDLEFVLSLEGYAGPQLLSESGPEPGPESVPTPVPGSLLLFGSGLLGWAGCRLKIKKS
jgi:hypothetical protein